MNIFKSAKEWAIPTLVGKIDFPKSFVERYEKEFGDIYESLPQQIIHRDPNPGNIILCGDNWGVLDFDLSERNIRIFDPCYAATAILSDIYCVDNTLFLDGNYITNEQMNDKRFLKLLEKNLF